MRVRRLLAVAVLALAPLVVPAAADPTPSPTGVPEAPLQIRVTDLLPRAPRPGNAFEVTGTVTNTGNTVVRTISVRLRVGDRIRTRSELLAADTDRPITLSRPATAVALPRPLVPGARVRFDLRTTVEALRFGGRGVYPLDVEALGDLGDGARIQRLGLVPTWVPWFGGSTVRKTRVAVLWPLVDKPRQSVDGRFGDDELATSLAPTGRLGELLRAGTAAATPQCEPRALGPDGLLTPAPTRCDSVPVTWAVDPDLLNAAGTMTKAYRVGTVSDTRPGTGTAAAKGFLSDLTTAVSSTEVLALPYADPDVTALTRRRGSPFSGDLARASLLGVEEVKQRLGVRPVSAVAWPPVERITSAGLDALGLTGATSYVLDASAFGQPDSEPEVTPGTRALLPASSIGGTPTGLVVEDQLSRLLMANSAFGPRIDEQRFLAETAIIAAQDPTLQRTFVLAPERRGAVSPGAAAGALRDLGRVPWLCPVRLVDVAAGTERCSDDDPSPRREPPDVADRGPLSQDRPGELPDDYLNPIGRDRDIAEQLTSEVLTDDVASREVVARMTAELRRSIARAESSAWQDDLTGRTRHTGLLHRHMSDLVGRVTVRGGRVLLTSASGRLQASLENRLDVPIRVRLRFSDSGAAIDRVTTGTIEVPPGSAVPAAVSVTTHKSGQFLVQAVVVDRSGQPFPSRGEPRTAVLSVRSTGYGRLAVAVTLGGAGVLFLAAGVRIVRRARARNHG